MVAFVFAGKLNKLSHPAQRGGKDRPINPAVGDLGRARVRRAAQGAHSALWKRKAKLACKPGSVRGCPL